MTTHEAALLVSVARGVLFLLSFQDRDGALAAMASLADAIDAVDAELRGIA